MSKPDKLKKSLVASFWDGVFVTCAGGMTTDYFTPYALALQATTRQIGVLSELLNLPTSLIQLKTADVTEKLKSRKIIITGVFSYYLRWPLPAGLSPGFFSPGCTNRHSR